jgi:hypothetical protein
MSDECGKRWCEAHQQWHGPLYRCEKYDDATLTKIAQDSQALAGKVNDPVWNLQQLANGIPPEVLVLLKVIVKAYQS